MKKSQKLQKKGQTNASNDNQMVIWDFLLFGRRPKSPSDPQSNYKKYDPEYFELIIRGIIAVCYFLRGFYNKNIWGHIYIYWLSGEYGDFRGMGVGSSIGYRIGCCRITGGTLGSHVVIGWSKYTIVLYS